MIENQRESQAPLDTLLGTKIKNSFIQSLNHHINAFFGGGLHHGMITQLYGEAGSGKTQLAMLFALGVISLSHRQWSEI